MKNKGIITVSFLSVLLLLTSCEAIQGIFKAGMGFGIFIVIAAIAVMVFIISRLTKKD